MLLKNANPSLDFITLFEIFQTQYKFGCEMNLFRCLTEKAGSKFWLPSDNSKIANIRLLLLKLVTYDIKRLNYKVTFQTIPSCN